MGEKARRDAWLRSQPEHVRFRKVMERVSLMLDDVFNHGLPKDKRLTGYALVTFPLKAPMAGAHYASNADMLTVAAILEAQAAHMRSLLTPSSQHPFLNAMAEMDAKDEMEKAREPT